MLARAPAIAACALFSALAQAQTPSFHLVGVPPGAEFSYINGLSADGSRAAGAGTSSGPFPNQPGFTWSAAGGRDDFGSLPGMPLGTVAAAISGDGATVAGTSRTGDYTTQRPY